MSAILEVRYHERNGHKFSVALHASGVLGVNYRGQSAFVTDRGNDRFDVKLMGQWRTNHRPTIEEAMELAFDLLEARAKPDEDKSQALQTTAWFQQLPPINESAHKRTP